MVSLEDCDKTAGEKGGRCLTRWFRGGSNKYTWVCNAGHTWEARAYDVVVLRYWCKKCVGSSLQKWTIEDCRKAAAEKGGICLSKTYEGANKFMWWRCREGHEWQTYPNSVKNCGAWCPQCAHISRRLCLEDCQNFAANKGGACLSEEYKGSGINIWWKCDQEQHDPWEATFNNVKAGRWCPACGFKGLSEGCAREIFERLLSIKLPKRRPPFLNGLELDGYDDDLGLAFEYNGAQHYKLVPHWHKGLAGLDAQQQRDRKKSVKCIAHGVELFVVPCEFDHRDPAAMEAYIRSLLEASYLI